MWTLQQINDKEFKLKTSVKLIKDNTLAIECAEHRSGKYHLFLSFSTFSTGDIKGMEISLSNTETFDFAPNVEQVKKWAIAKIKEMLNPFNELC